MKVLVSIICCLYKEYSLEECIENIKIAGFEDILLNFEGQPIKNYDVKYLQTWNWDGAGKVIREYDYSWPDTVVMDERFYNNESNPIIPVEHREYRKHPRSTVHSLAWLVLDIDYDYE